MKGVRQLYYYIILFLGFENRCGGVVIKACLPREPSLMALA